MSALQGITWIILAATWAVIIFSHISARRARRAQWSFRVSEVRQMMAHLDYLLRVIESGPLPEGVVPVVEADGDTAADHECGRVSCLVSEREDKKLVLLESIDDSLTDLRKLVLPKVVGQASVSDVRH